jgi:hypothetical protein
MTPPSHVQGWTRLTLSRAPCSRGHDASQWCPQQVEQRHKGVTTIAIDIDVSEDLRPTQRHKGVTTIAIDIDVSEDLRPTQHLPYVLAQASSPARSSCPRIDSTGRSPSQPKAPPRHHQHHRREARTASPQSLPSVRCPSQPSHGSHSRPRPAATARSQVAPSARHLHWPRPPSVPPEPAAAAARRPAAPRTSHTSRRTATGSSRGNIGSGGPILLHRQPVIADEEVRGTRQPRPPQSTGEEKRGPRRRLPRRPHEQPASCSGSGAARRGEVRMAAPRRLGLGVRSVARAGGDASVSFSLMYRNKTISEQIDSRGHMPVR